MTTEKTLRWTFLWGLRGRRVGLRDAFAARFGQLRDADSVATARAAERLLGPDHERRWGWLMPQRARRLLVVGMVVTWAVVIAAGVTPAPLVPGFVLSAAAYVLVRQAFGRSPISPNGTWMNDSSASATKRSPRRTRSSPECSP